MTRTTGASDPTPLRVLARHFRRRLLEPEDATGEETVSLFYAFACLSAPGVAATFLLLLTTMRVVQLRLPVSEIARIAAADRLFFVVLSMTVTGLATLLTWEVLFPDRKDYVNLRPLPLPTRTLFLAKLSGLAAVMAGFTLAADGIPALLAPQIWVDAAEVGHSFRAIGAFLAATLGGAAFVFFALASLQGLLQAVLPPRVFRRASAAVQAAALTALLVLFFLRGAAESAWHGADRAFAFTRALPPLWFAGLQETLLGRGGPGDAALARTAVLALAVSAVLFVAAYALSYRRFVAGTLDAPHVGPTASRTDLLMASLARRFRDPEAAAMFRFTFWTLGRSARHRLTVATGAALALAISLVSGLAAQHGDVLPSTALLAVPLVQIFCLAVALRAALARPVELPAAWAVHLVPRNPRALAAGAEAAATLIAVVPPALIGVAITLPLHGPLVAALALLYDMGAGLLLLAVLFSSTSRLPLLSPAMPGEGRIHERAFPWLLAFFLFVQGGAALCRGLLPRPATLVAAASLLALLAVTVRRLRRRAPRPGFEPAPDAVPSLGLGPRS